MRVDDVWNVAPPAATNVLAHLNAVPEGQVIKTLLRNLLQHCDEQNRFLSDEALYRSQGSAQTLAALVEALETARERQ